MSAFGLARDSLHLDGLTPDELAIHRFWTHDGAAVGGVRSGPLDSIPDHLQAENMAAIGLILIVIIVGFPLAYMIWRFKRGEEAVSGGSLGTQLFGRNKD